MELGVLISGVAVAVTCLTLMARGMFVMGRSLEKVDGVRTQQGRLCEDLERLRVSEEEGRREARGEAKDLRRSISNVHDRVDQAFTKLSSDVSDSRDRLGQLEGAVSRMNGGGKR